MAEHNLPAPNFLLKDMPRMGRRNALLPDDVGSASPLNLMSQSMASTIASHDEKPTEESGPKLNEVAAPLEKNSESEKAEAEKTVDEEQKAGAPSSVLKKTRVRVKLDSLKEDGKQSTVIPWKQQDAKQTTIVEEKRKIFESFEKTSADPPDTPRMSESKLKKKVSKVKTRGGFDLHSPLSFSISVQKTNNKKEDPYAFVTAKVNTRWSKIGSLGEWKNLRRPVGVYPSAMSSGANRAKKVVVRNKSAPVVSRTLPGGNPINSKRRIQDRFPLTIPPQRFKSPKNISAQARAQIISDVTKRLYSNGQTPIQKFRTEIIQQQRQMELQAPSANAYKSTLFNLHRINNTGILGHSRQQQQGIGSQTVNPTHVLGHNPQTVTIMIGSATNKQVPPVQTIQAPPSPFLTSNVSIPNQLMEIPINGEIMKTATKTKPAVTNVHPSSSKSKKTGGKSAVVQNIADKPKGKAAATANKYNKIYIGPYSGSESEGEQQAAPKAPAQNPPKQAPPPSPPHSEQSSKKKPLKK